MFLVNHLYSQIKRASPASDCMSKGYWFMTMLALFLSAMAACPWGVIAVILIMFIYGYDHVQSTAHNTADRRETGNKKGRDELGEGAETQNKA